MNILKKHDWRIRHGRSRLVTFTLCVLVILMAGAFSAADLQAQVDPPLQTACDATWPKFDGRGMRAYWTFDDQADPLRDDYGTNVGVNNGTVWHSSTQGSSGNISGGKMFYDGSSHVALYADASGADLDIHNWPAQSISLWFQHTGAANTTGWREKLIDKTIPGHDFYLAVETQYNGRLMFQTYHNDAQQYVNMLEESRDYGDGTWYHVVIVKYGASGQHGQMWVNGELLLQRDDLRDWYYPGTVPPLLLGKSGITIYWPSYWPAHWNGWIDEVALFDRVLSEAEIVRLYYNGLAHNNACSCSPPYEASDETTLNEAIACVNTAGAGTHTIDLLADIELSDSATPFNNSAATAIVVEGNGFTVDGNNSGTVFTVAPDTGVTMRNFTITGGYGDAINQDGNGNNAGGIYSEGSLTLQSMYVIDNHASGIGGGLFVARNSTAMIQNSLFEGNVGVGWGGAIFNWGDTSIEDTTFRANISWGGAAIMTEDWAGYHADLTVDRCTFVGNEGNLPGREGQGWGAGINSNSKVVVRNSTFSGSRAQNGAIYTSAHSGPADLTLVNSTVAYNTGHGLYNNFGGQVTLINSILSGSSGSDCTGTSLGGDDINNLVEDGSCGCPFSSDPLLGPLADNGGPTLTHALLPGSLAIDGVPSGDCSLTIDQRGWPRPHGAVCDIGAFELERAPVADPNGPYLTAVNAPVAFDGAASFDPDGDPLTYDWSFGDSGSGTGATPSHTYVMSDIYDVCLTVSDGHLDSDEVCTLAVVYDSEDGFVTGGGWINSPEGAYTPDPSLTGKANFGFVSKYKKGAHTPTGNTEFHFKTAVLNFQSESYDWLVVTGSGYARFKGVGDINGQGEYKFMIWAGDKEPDTFRIKIWTEDEFDNETLVYDNGTDQQIGGGSIIVHTKK